MSLSEVQRGSWCPYCATPSRVLCNDMNCDTCFRKSFASVEQSKFWSCKNVVKPRELFKTSKTKYLFECSNCNHEFESSLNNISDNHWCPYCSNPPKRLCDNNDCDVCFSKSFASHYRSEFWSKSNKLSPREYIKGSRTKVDFDCQTCGLTFSSAINNVVYSNTWCTLCKCKTETKLLQFLQTKFPSIERQKSFDWCKTTKHYARKYDFYIPQKRLLIELDGGQHFRQISNWTAPEETQKIDILKNNLAIENGFTIIRICQEIVFYNKEQWDTQLLSQIDRLNRPNLICIGTVYSNS
jgi:very-short-patch-repair endonuclease/DNA-directed RNA polymerase subunit RPC12/RpoP